MSKEPLGQRAAMRAARAREPGDVAQRVAQHHGAAAIEMRQQDQPLFAVRHRRVSLRIDRLEQKLIRRRVVIAGARRALDHTALHFGRAIGHADERRMRTEALQTLFKILARRVAKTFAGDKDEPHRRQLRAELFGARRHFANEGRHAPQNGRARALGDRDHVIEPGADLRLSLVDLARQRRDDGNIHRRGRVHGARKSAVRIARQRKQIENRIGGGDAAQPHHVAVEREDIDEVVGGGDERRRLSRRTGRVHDVPDDGFRIVGRARRAKHKSVGLGDIVGLGGDRKLSEIGEAAHVSAIERGAPRICACNRDARQRPGRGWRQIFARAGSQAPRRRTQTGNRRSWSFFCKPEYALVTTVRTSTRQLHSLILRRPRSGPRRMQAAVPGPPSFEARCRSHLRMTDNTKRSRGAFAPELQSSSCISPSHEANGPQKGGGAPKGACSVSAQHQSMLPQAGARRGSASSGTRSPSGAPRRHLSQRANASNSA